MKKKRWHTAVLPPKQFTYQRLKVDGEIVEGKYVFLNNGREVFKEPIECNQTEAKILVDDLNAIPPKKLRVDAETLIQYWFRSIAIRKAREAEKERMNLEMAAEDALKASVKPKRKSKAKAVEAAASL